MEVLVLKQVEKTSTRDGKNWLENPLKILIKQAKGAPFYRLPKTSRWRPTQQEILLSVDRLVDRPTVKFLTVVACRSTARSTMHRA